MLEIQSTDLIMDLTAILKGRQSLKNSFFFFLRVHDVKYFSLNASSKKNNSELKVEGKELYQPI